jgi:1-acyl-sn-glycerol-3-phosphate acyltransferase
MNKDPMNSAPNPQLPWRVRLLHNLAWFCLRLLTRIDVQGTERVPPAGVTMVIMNHLHWLDPVIGVAVFQRSAVMFTAEKWEHRPVIGDVIRWTRRAIFVRRGELDRRALTEALEVLHAGDILALAPEGTRSKTGALQQAHDGAAYLVTRSGAVVVPMVAYGQEQAESHWKRLRRPRIVVRVGEPFRFEDTPNKVRSRDLSPYTEEMMRRLAALLPPGYRGVYAEQGAAPSPVEHHTYPSAVDASIANTR